MPVVRTKGNAIFSQAYIRKRVEVNNLVGTLFVEKTLRSDGGGGGEVTTMQFIFTSVGPSRDNYTLGKENARFTEPFKG